jgi:hypothetical protein
MTSFIVVASFFLVGMLVGWLAGYQAGKILLSSKSPKDQDVE